MTTEQMARNAVGPSAHEYDIRFSRARQMHGLPAFAVMRLEARDDSGDFWKAVSEHHTEKEAEQALFARRKAEGPGS